MLRGKKILVTGLTGQVAYPVALAYAKDNEVWGIARFGDAEKRAELEKKGIRCVALDLEQGDFSSLPDDFDYVLNFAVFKGAAQSFDQDIRANAEGVGLLMSHCRKAKAFLHCSTTGVYQSVGHEMITETSDLGDNHRVFMKTYSITKICTEAVVRFAAREFNLPTVICRLNVPYGDEGGWPYMHLQLLKNDSAIPVHTNKPNLFAPIHEDDIIASIPALLDAATTPVRIVNWAGNETVSIEEWSEYLGELIGKKPQFNYTEHTIESVLVSNQELQKIAGPTKVTWKDGLRRMVSKRHPDWLVN
jgi:UDP-glucuronate 4-epimerase